MYPRTTRRRFLAATAVVLTLATLAFAADPAPPKTSPDTGTQILKWKDGKRACFMLAFDDGAPSQLKNVIPELQKRKITGTFYLVTGNSLYASLKSKWEEAVKSPYIVPANHTFMHKGVNNVQELDQELEKNNAVLYALHPDRKTPRLLGFGKPGGVPWNVTNEEVQQQLTKHHLLDRPPFYGPPIHYKSKDECLAAIDTAIKKGEMGHFDFHGVGGDWLTTPMDWFLPILDKLEAEREQLWITDTVSWGKYVKERAAAKIEALETTPTQIRLKLTCTLDPALFDAPLTLSTKIPDTWKTCTVTQGATKAEARILNGAAQYDALPGGGEIILAPAK